MIHFLIVGVLVVLVALATYFGIDALDILPASSSSQAASIDQLFQGEIVVISFLFALIVVPLFYSLVVFRRRSEDEHGAYITGNTPLELAWSFIPLGIVLYFAYWGAQSLGEVRRVNPQALEVRVIGFQWGWRYEYPDYGIQTTTLYLPVDRQVKLSMESLDVIHSFWVPEFRIKQDLVPGRVTELRLTPSETGTFTNRCAEICGTAHAYMLSDVVVMTGEEFDAWLEDQDAAAAEAAEGERVADPENGRLLAEANGCLACHSLDGSDLVGPTWLGLYEAPVELADGTVVTADDAYLIESIVDPNATIVAGYAPVMPPYTMSEADLADIIAFIESLK